MFVNDGFRDQSDFVIEYFDIEFSLGSSFVLLEEEYFQDRFRCFVEFGGGFDILVISELD